MLVRRAVFLVPLFLWCQQSFAQGHCARVSTDVTFFFGVATEVPDPNHPVTVDIFHTDLELSFRRSGWAVVVSYEPPDAPPEGLDLLPAEALLFANPSTRFDLASVPLGFEFIGAKPGEPFWILPQNTFTNALALGIAIERADRDRLCSWNPGDTRGADTDDRWFEFRLMELHGPADANFAMWQADGVSAPVVHASTHEGGITEDDVFYMTEGGHTHMNWGFTQPGLYAIDFRVSTVLRCEESLSADWAPLGNTFYNGDCRVDALDFAHLAAHWLETPDSDDPNTWMFVDPYDPEGPIHTNDLVRLMDQWLECGYPGCNEE